VIFHFSHYDDATIEQYLRKANNIYAQARIKLEKGTFKKWDYEETQQRTVGQFQATQKDQPPLDSNIKSITQGQNTKRITAYFVNKLNPATNEKGHPIMGLAIMPKFEASPPAPSLLLKDGLGSAETGGSILAHEIGHILWEKAGIHHHRPDNLMYDSYGQSKGTLLTLEQIQTMRNHELVH
jgi:hypothetical protein